MMDSWNQTDAGSLKDAIEGIERQLPGWWWTIGACSLTRHASCGPDRTGQDAHLLAQSLFDGGFHADLADGTLADALRDVTKQAVAAKAGQA